MKPRSLFLTLTLGVTAGLFACQDGGVTAPDDLQPQFAKGGNKPPNDPPPGGVNFSGVLTGSAADGWSWNTKKGVFIANGPVTVNTSFTEEPLDLGLCIVSPAGADGGPLLEALAAGFQGKSANVHVSPEHLNEASDLHRVLSLVEGPVVRYFWVGPRYQFVDDFPSGGTVSGWDENEDRITFTLTGGIIGVRDTGTPKKAVKIGCPYTGSVVVTLTKNQS